MTGVLNRRAWDRELARAIAEAARLDRSVAVALIDLDEFKRLNDTRGHDAGDRALADAARWWRSQLRSADLLARVGGDEFAVLLADCDREHLDAIVRRLKQRRPDAPGCSIGLATWHHGEDAADLMRRADQALYADKAGARRHPAAA